MLSPQAVHYNKSEEAVAQMSFVQQNKSALLLHLSASAVKQIMLTVDLPKSVM